MQTARFEDDGATGRYDEIRQRLHAHQVAVLPSVVDFDPPHTIDQYGTQRIFGAGIVESGIHGGHLIEHRFADADVGHGEAYRRVRSLPATATHHQRGADSCEQPQCHEASCSGCQPTRAGISDAQSDWRVPKG